MNPANVALTEICVRCRRRLGNPHIRRKLDIFLEVQFHALVGVGMVLTLLAVLKFTDGNPLSQCKTFLYSGSAVTGVAVLLLGAWALSTLATVNAGVGAASRMNTKGAREVREYSLLWTSSKPGLPMADQFSLAASLRDVLRNAAPRRSIRIWHCLRFAADGQPQVWLPDLDNSTNLFEPPAGDAHRLFLVDWRACDEEFETRG